MSTCAPTTPTITVWALFWIPSLAVPRDHGCVHRCGAMVTQVYSWPTPKYSLASAELTTRSCSSRMVHHTGAIALLPQSSFSFAYCDGSSMAERYPPLVEIEERGNPTELAASRTRRTCMGGFENLHNERPV